MFVLGIVFASLVILQGTSSAPLQEDKIAPVHLHYTCLHVQEVGKEHNKSPVLLLHGLGGTHNHWDGVSQVLALRTGREVCAVDLRNHGDSPWDNRTDIPAMTADVENFLNERKIKKVNLIGHSLGGKIAVHYALNHPERVDSVVVEDMRPNGVTPLALKLVRTMGKFLLESIETVPNGSTVDEARKIVADFFRKKLAELGLSEVIEEKDAKSLAIRCVNGKCEWKMNAKVVLGTLHDTSLLIESKGLYEGPALFIYGTESPFDVGDDKGNILKLFPNARLFPVEGASHVIHGKYREFDEEVLRILLKLDVFQNY